MKRILICLVVFLFAAVQTAAREVQLTLHPAKSTEQEKYQLLPKAEEQSDSDAWPFYKKAIESLPENGMIEKIGQWRSTPLDELPIKQVKSALQQLNKPLQFVEQAAGCKWCSWPGVEYYTTPKNLTEYRKIAYILALQVRLQITQGEYEQAIDTMQVGLTIAQQLGEGPATSQGLVGIAISALMLMRVEELVQEPNAPNLHRALQDLPKPLVDLSKQLGHEPQSIHKRVQMLMNRLDRHKAMLQCIEAMRLYAGDNNGKFPNKLSEITQVTIPSDPSQKPFIYRRTGSEAILETPAVKGIEAENMINYKLILKE